jgi:hypothetical protein
MNPKMVADDIIGYERWEIPEGRWKNFRDKVFDDNQHSSPDITKRWAWHVANVSK